MKTILLIGSGWAVYREYALRALASKYRIVLLDGAAPTWQAPYIVDYSVAPMADHKLSIEMAMQLASRAKVDGVLTYEESSLELAAIVSDRLGLRFLTQRTASLCRDKHRMRDAFWQSRVPSCRSVLAHTLSEALDAASRIGYPVVLKPRALAASIGVIKVTSQQELPAAYEFAAGAKHPRFVTDAGILVEEYLEGPEVSVECAVIEGEVHVVALTRKRLGFPPYFEEIGHVVSPGEAIPEDDSVRQVVAQAHLALGITRGVTHTECRLTTSGPRIVEVNGRLGGDLIPYLVWLAAGVDLTLAAADIAVGEVPSIAASRRSTAAVRFFYPKHDGKVVSLAADEAVLRRPDVDFFAWELSVGEEIHLPPRGMSTRLGLLVVTGKSISDCDTMAAQVQEGLYVQLEPI